MAPRREFAEDKFAPSAFRGMSDPAGGMFNSTSPSGLPVGQVLLGAGGMSLKKAMDFVNAVKEGKIDPNSDEGMRETLNLALLTIGRGAPTARPGGIAPALEGTIFPAERGATSQLGYRGAPTIENILELPPGAIRGTSAEGAPRIAYLKPEQRYRMAVDRPAETRPLSNYENPVRDQTFVAPEEMRPWSAGEVRTPVDPIAALNTETVVPVSNAPKWADFRLQDAQRAEAMKNEGGVWPTQQRTLRRLAGESEADFRLRQELALGDEAGAITSGRNPPNRVARALQLTERQPPAAPPEFVGPPEMQGPRQITPENFIGPAERQGPPELIGPRQTPQMTLIEQLRSGQISGREYQAAIDAQRTAAAAPSVESPLARAMASAPEGVAVDPVQAAINAAKQRADAMARSHADATAQQAVIDAAAQRAGTGSGPMFPNYKPYSPPSMTVPLVGAGAIGAGALALNSGKQRAMDAVAGADEAAQQAAIDAMRGRDEFNQTAPNTFNQQEAIRIASTRPEFNQSWSNQASVRPVASTTAAVRSQQATPTPMMRPESSPSPKDSILSRIFSGQDYQSSGPTRGDNRLYQGEKDGRKVINWGDPESAADFFRASKAQQDWNAQNPDSPSIGAGMKRGGAANAKPGKDEAVHKALDIIQHLLMRH